MWNTIPEWEKPVQQKLRIQVKVPNKNKARLMTQAGWILVAAIANFVGWHVVGEKSVKDNLKNHPEVILQTLSEQQLNILQAATKQALAEKTGGKTIPE
jgi:hypothetical protein